jgi:hypothetical protein
MAAPQTEEQIEKTTEKLKMISDIVSLAAKSLQGVADAMKKCADNPGPPRCIEPASGGKGKKMKGGVRTTNPRKSGNSIIPRKSMLPENAITGPNSSGAEAVRIAEKVSGIVLRAINDFIVPYIEKEILGGDINSLSTEELTSNLQVKTKNIQRIINDPKMQEAIKELVMAYTTLIIQIIEIAQPDIYIMTDKIWETISETINQSVIGAFSTGFNISGAIPFVGWITDIINIASSIGKSTSPTIRLTTDAIDKSVAMASKIAKTIEAGQERINEASNSFNQARQVINNPVGLATSAVASRVNKASDAAASAVASRVNKASDAAASAVASRVDDKVSAAEAAGNAAIARAASKPAAAASAVASRVNKATPRVIRPRVPGIRPRVPPMTGGGSKKKRISVRATKKRNKNKKMKKMKRVTMRRRK